MNQFFITGIDTGIGKTVVTGLIAKYFLLIGKKATTMKPVQTGCDGIAEDILVHRSIMGVEPDRFDLDGITAPFVFKYPASPHLAAELEGREIDVSSIDNSLKILDENFEVVLIEGAGGIYVPITRNYTTLDFIAQRSIPTIVVSSPKLGSINHTMMTLEMLKSRNIPVAALIYNMYPAEKEEISNDSINVIKHFSKKIGLEFPVFATPFIDEKSNITVDFEGLK
jgi:dethiobiotin synthetase